MEISAASANWLIRQNPLFLALILTLPPCIAQTDQRLVFSKYFPMITGATYDVRDTDADGNVELGTLVVGAPRMIDGVPGWTMPIDVRAPGGQVAFTLYYQSDLKNGFRDWGSDDELCSFRHSPASRVPNGMLPGETTTHTIRITGRNKTVGAPVECESSTVRQIVRFEGFQTVTVPAGTFDNCAKVVTEDAYEDGFVLTTIIYLAPDVGFVKIVDPHPTDGSTLELLSYRLPITINVTSFIPPDAIPGPLPEAVCLRPSRQQLYLGGDNRGFEPFGSTFRTRQLITIIPSNDPSGQPRIVDGSAMNLTSPSSAYAADALADGRIDENDDDQTGDCHLLHERNPTSNAGMQIIPMPVSGKVVATRFRADARNSVLFFSCDISVDITVFVDTSSSPPVVSLSGSHDGFPAYEIYVNQHRVYQYPGPPLPYGVFDILRLCGRRDVVVNRSGITLGRSSGPIVSNAAIANAASFQSGITPGGLVTVFGRDLGAQPGQILVAADTPWSLQLAGTSVLVDGTPTPIYSLANIGGQEQISVHAPFDLVGKRFATVEVTTASGSSGGLSAPVLASQPGLFLLEGGNGAILHGANNAVVGPTSPASAAEVIVIYLTGMGAVSNPPAFGAPASTTQLSTTISTPRVLIGGNEAQVLFSGLAPGYIGLYQINARVPTVSQAGLLDVTVEANGVRSNVARLAVR